MRGNHTGTHPHPEGDLGPIRSGESGPLQGQVNPASKRKSLPVGRIIFAAVAGGLAGVLGLLLHGSSANLDGFRFPWGLLIALGLSYLVVYQAGVYGGQVHPRFTVLTAFFAWAGAVFVNFIAFFFPGNDRFYLPAPLSHDPFASWALVLDRGWQFGLFLILPLVTWHLLQVLRREKD